MNGTTIEWPWSKTLSAVMWGAVLTLIGCGDSSEDIAESTAELQPSDAAILGFEDASAWSASRGPRPELSSNASQGTSSLAVAAAGYTVYTSQPVNLAATPLSVTYEIRRPGSAAGWAGQTQLYLECREKNIYNAFVGARELSDLPLGAFEPTRFRVDESLRARFAGGCSRATLKIVLNTSTADAHLLDNLRVQTRGARVTMNGQRQCGLPSTEYLLPGATETAAGHWDYQDWALARNAQLEQRRLERVLADFSGYVPAALDHVNHQVVLAVDALEADGESIRQAVEKEEIDLPVTIQPPCYPLATLRAAAAAAQARDWHAAAKNIAFGAFQDSNSGRLLATFSESDGAAAAALKAKLGDVLRVEWGQPSRLARLDDGQPHFGGAAIGTLNSNFCTSAFTITSGAGRGAVTAAHCNFVPGTSVYSGPKLYGLAVNPGLYPTYDMFRIDPNGQTFSNTIHTDPCCPVARLITAKANPSLNSTVCFSGYVTKAKCGITVTALGQPWCDSSGCTTNLAVGERAGVTIGQPGDSGGPVYVSVAGGDFAAARGMIVARDTPSRIYFHVVSDIESRLGVTIATN